MPLLIDIEKDGLYQMGLKKGREKAAEKAALLKEQQEKTKALLKEQQEKTYLQISKMLDAGLNIEQIADFTMLSEKEVMVIIKKIEVRKKK